MMAGEDAKTGEGVVELPPEMAEALTEVSKKVPSGKELVVTIGKGKGARVEIVDPENEGLRASEIAFINEYMVNGFNGTRAYLKAHPNVSEDTARSTAPKILAKSSVATEIRNRLQAQRVTEAWVIQNLMEKAGFNDSFRINAATTAALGLAKTLGMLTDTKKQPFTGENPALFLPLYTKEEKELFDKQRKEMGRVTE